MKKIVNYLKNKNNLFNLLLLFSIVLIAFLLRSKQYLLGDFNYNLDQSRDLLLVKEIIENHKLTLIGGRSGFGGIFHGPLWLYIVTPFFILAKGNPFFTLVPLYIIFDVSLIVLGYYLISKLFNKTTGLLFSSFLAISRSLIESSSNFSNSNIMPLIFLIYLFFAIKFLRGNNYWFIALLFVSGIGFQFQSAFAIFLLPLTLILILLRKKFPNLKIFFLGGLAMITSMATFIVFDIRHKFLMTKSALKIVTGDTPPMAGYKEFASISYRIVDRLIGFINYFFRPLFSPNLSQKIFVTIILICFVVLIVKIKSKVKFLFKREILLLLLIPSLYFIIYIAYPYPLWSHYTNPLTISSCLLLSLVIYKLFELKLKYISIGLKIFLVILLFPVFVFLYKDYFTLSSISDYKKQLSVARYIFDDANNKSFGYLIYDHGQLTYNMDYLMWWLAKDVYHVPLINNKQPITYLIIYSPPIFAKNAPKYWKTDVIKTKGTVIGKKSFTKDITVEKIQIDNVEKEDPVDPNYFQNLIFR